MAAVAGPPASSGPITFQRGAGQSAFQRLIRRVDFSIPTKEYDLIKVLEQFTEKFQAELSEVMQEYHAVRVYFVVTLMYKSKEHPELEEFPRYLRTKERKVQSRASIPDDVAALCQDIQTKNENLVNGSNLQIQRIFYLSIFISRFEPLAATGFIRLPEFLSKKRAIVNVKNRDERCFGYAVAAALLREKEKPLPRRLARHFQEFGLHDLSYPVHPEDIEEIEKKIHVRINVFSFFDDQGLGRYPLYIGKNFEAKDEVDLLYWGQDDSKHYAWIKSFSAFISDLYAHHGRKFFCKRCFGIFLRKEQYDRHLELCDRPDFDSQIYTFSNPGQFLQFQNWRHQLKAPFVIYADFECILKPLEQGDIQPRTIATQLHVPAAVGLFIVPAVSCAIKPRYEYYSGPDVVHWLLNRLLELARELMPILDDEKRLIMTDADIQAFVQATQCFICRKPFIQSEEINRKVRDHDHLTGRFRGAAHANCNLQLKLSHKLPVFFHNFRGYDSHLITLGVEKFPNEKISVLGQNFEKYLVMRFGRFIIFKDSLQFMGYSLERLCSELLLSGPDRFRYLREAFAADYTEQEVSLLLRKGVFPYEYLDSWEKLKCTELPPIEAFYSALRQSHCSPEDYAHAQLVWRVFHCNTLLDYMLLYLKTDVLILADVFENFRAVALQNYQLDPGHYLSSPQLFWDAMLLRTQVKLELISDPQVFSLLQQGIRGGISMIVRRYAAANNPQMGTDYNPTRPLGYIVYLDANNLYGWAMSQPMPIDSFGWLREDEWGLLDWVNLDDDAEYGYIVECDLDYPNVLHDLHSDYPLAPERRIIQCQYYNEQQLKLLDHYSIQRSGLQVPKLFTHFLPHTHYVTHYRNLKFYLEEGMILRKVHKVLRFRQSRWFAPYILMNQDLRAQAKSEIEKNQAKLANNATFGKCCENPTKRTDFRITKNALACKRLIEKPQMKGFKIFTDNLAIVELRKLFVLIDKPYYVGFSVLEVSKLHMYSFHYRYVKRKFGNAARLLFTDTDSLMYEFTGLDPYTSFCQDRTEFFDFSNFPKSHPCYSPNNNKVIGMFKDESGGKQIKSFVGLRPKMYSYQMAGPVPESKHTAKGIQYAASKSLRHEDFLRQLQRPKENYLVNRRIGSRLHQIYSFQTKKRGLCAFDDKRVVLEDGIETLPYGHFRITAGVTPIGAPEFISDEDQEQESAERGPGQVASCVASGHVSIVREDSCEFDECAETPGMEFEGVVDFPI